LYTYTAQVWYMLYSSQRAKGLHVPQIHTKESCHSSTGTCNGHSNTTPFLLCSKRQNSITLVLYVLSLRVKDFLVIPASVIKSAGI
jgi:hypothetical protein